jgi:hypothetical protein
MKKTGTITAAALGLLLLTGCAAKKHGGGFKAVTVGRDDLQITVLATGNVQPSKPVGDSAPYRRTHRKNIRPRGRLREKGRKIDGAQFQ